jgi:1-phosphofructokinase
MNPKAQIATVTLNPAIDQTVAIPNFAAGCVNRVVTYRSDAGGKGVNVAAFLADYGFAIAATGFLGRENPHLFKRLFQQKHISDHFIRIAGSTRTGVKIIDKIKQETTDINFPGQNPTPADVKALFDKMEILAANCTWFVLAGSIPAGTSPEIYGELIKAIAAKGVKVALDASGDGLRCAVQAAPTLIKPNMDELQEFTGRKLNNQQDVIGAARSLLDKGIQTVVVSMGAQGALFVESNAVIRAIPPQVQVKSTVGAGDAMLSGMVAGKIENRSLSDCARLATAFSVVAVTHIGAGLPPAVQLTSMANAVQLVNVNSSNQVNALRAR